MKEKAKKNGWFTLLKVLLVIVITIVILLVAAYLVLKYFLGIDIFAIKKQVELLSKPIDKEQVLQDVPTTADEEALITKLKEAGLSTVMPNNSLNELLDYYFSTDYNSSIQIDRDINLTNKEITIISKKLFAKLLESFSEEERENIGALNPEIIQLKMSNLRAGTASLFFEKLVDFDVVLKVNIDEIKETFDFFPASLVTKKIPKEIYLFLNFTVGNTNVAFGYSYENDCFSVNTLTIEQTKKLLKVFSFINLGSMEDLSDELDSMVSSLIFGLVSEGGGVTAEPGVISLFNALGASGYEFVADGENISIKIKN